MKPCPLGYNCEYMSQVNTDKWGDKHCENENACKEWALSWGLPYKYLQKEKTLVVEFKPHRYYWAKEVQKLNPWDSWVCDINGMEFGWSCPASDKMMTWDFESDELDITAIIIQELTNAGWQEAVPLSLKPKLSTHGIIALKPTILTIISKVKNSIVDRLRRLKWNVH